MHTRTGPEHKAIPFFLFPPNTPRVSSLKEEAFVSTFYTQLGFGQKTWRSEAGLPGPAALRLFPAYI